MGKISLQLQTEDPDPGEDAGAESPEGVPEEPEAPQEESEPWQETINAGLKELTQQVQTLNRRLRKRRTRPSAEEPPEEIPQEPSDPVSVDLFPTEGAGDRRKKSRAREIRLWPR